MRTPEIPPAVAEASAWFGRDLQTREAAWVFHLTQLHCAELDAAIRAFQDARLPLTTIEASQFALPTLGPQLRNVRDELLEGRGFVLLRGFEVGRYPRQAQAIAFMGLGAHLGVPRSQNAKGHLLGHVKDLGLDVTDPNVRYYQTHRKLEYHTDSCDIVGLLCLQTAKAGGESFIVSSMTLYNEVLRPSGPTSCRRCSSPIPPTGAARCPRACSRGSTCRSSTGMRGGCRASTCASTSSRRSATFRRPQRLTPQQNRGDGPARRAGRTTRRSTCRWPSGPATCSSCTTTQILHSRNDFENWPEPARHRHLLRLWLAPREARPLPAVFAPRYGSVTPGARGGIVVRGTQPTVPMEAE